MKSLNQRTSDLLLTAIERMRERNSLTIEETVGMLQGRGFGLVIILFMVCALAHFLRKCREQDQNYYVMY